MTSGKQALIVRPLFLGPISIAVFTVSFVIGLPFTTVSFYNSPIGIALLITPGLLSGLVMAYPTVAFFRLENRGGAPSPSYIHGVVLGPLLVGVHSP